MKLGRLATVVLLVLALGPPLYVAAYFCLVRVETYGFGDQTRPRYARVGGDGFGSARTDSASSPRAF